MRSEGAACQYSSSPRRGTSANKHELQLKLNRLENLVRELAEKHSTDDGAKSGLRESNEDEPTTSEARLSAGEENVYRGATAWTSLVEGIQDVNNIVAAEDEDGTPDELEIAESDTILGGGVRLTVGDIVDRLPSRTECDRLVSAYFNARFIAVPFIHIHHFKRRYDSFWDDPPFTNFLWISILLSILSCGAMVLRSKSTDASLACISVECSKELLDLSSRCLIAGKYLKAKPFSVEALLMHTHARNVQKQDADSTVWALYGLTVRLGQRQGYHRDTAKLASTYTPFEQEMRRRVWFMIQATELLYSFQNGMHSVVNQDCCDVDHPTNLTDDDFDESTAVLPEPRAPNDPNPILVYVFKSRLCRIMRRILHHCVSTSPTPYTEILNRNHDLEEWHASLPLCLRIRPIHETSFTDQNHTIMHRLMLELLYLKSLCILHRPYLTIEDQDEMYSISRKICRESALRILEIQIELDREIQAGGRMYDERYTLSNLTSHHFLLGAMALCLDLSKSEAIRYVVGDAAMDSKINAFYSTEDRRKNIRMLRTVHEIWVSRSSFSADAMQASQILRLILLKANSFDEASADESIASDDPGSSGQWQGSNHPTNSSNDSPLAFGIPSVASGTSPENTITGYGTGLSDTQSFDDLFSDTHLLDWVRTQRVMGKCR